MNPKDFEEALHDLEVRLERLKALYEQYFQGIERLEPAIPRKELDRRLNVLKREQPRNTALRFRFQMIQQRYTSYQTYWSRVARQIEEGTYRRDVMRARQLRRGKEAKRQRENEAHREAELAKARRAERTAEETERELAAARSSSASGEGGANGHDDAVDDEIAAALSALRARRAARTESEPRVSDSSVQPARPVGQSVPVRTFARPGGDASRHPVPGRPEPAPPRESPRQLQPPPPVPAATSRGHGGSALGDDHIRSIYREYVEARRRNNERTDNVRFEAVEKSIRAMLPKLEEKHRGKRIDFEVVIKNGRVGLKPVPK